MKNETRTNQLEMIAWIEQKKATDAMSSHSTIEKWTQNHNYPKQFPPITKRAHFSHTTKIFLWLHFQFGIIDSISVFACRAINCIYKNFSERKIDSRVCMCNWYSSQFSRVYWHHSRFLFVCLCFVLTTLIHKSHSLSHSWKWQNYGDCHKINSYPASGLMQ